MIKTIKGGNVPTRKQIRKAEHKAYKQNLKMFGKEGVRELDEFTAKKKAFKSIGLDIKDLQGLTDEVLMKLVASKLRGRPEAECSRVINVIFNYRHRR